MRSQRLGHAQRVGQPLVTRPGEAVEEGQLRGTLRFQPRQVRVPEIPQVTDVAQHGLRARNRRRPQFPDGPQRRLGAVVVVEDQRRIARQPARRRQETPDPEQRGIDDQPVARLDVQRDQRIGRGHEGDLARGRRLAVDDALGRGRAARCIDHHRAVGGRDGGGYRRDHGRRGACVPLRRRRQIVERARRPARLHWPIEPYAAQMRRGLQRERRGAVRIGQRGQRGGEARVIAVVAIGARAQQMGNIGVMQGEGQFGRREESAERHRDPADPRHGQPAGQPFRPVGKEDADPAALARSLRGKAPRDCGGAPFQFGECPRLAVVDQGQAVRPSCKDAAPPVVDPGRLHRRAKAAVIRRQCSFPPNARRTGFTGKPVRLTDQKPYLTTSPNVRGSPRLAAVLPVPA
ncbi:MAG: hypothetical protein CVT83_01020 [Alphaproteobacteria bacterium HGW-Alphaproteobacteria-5]|nr:MAG: hypothetical protein CVT83_01020 [Alphaproteobacteria bacterium HGW-Alphaproteobacteria-5]